MAQNPYRPLTKVLVANRGEIARRLLRALREAGIASVAVYSDADARAPHVGEADEAVRLGAGPSAESYLHVERLLDAARRTGADGVHPGYGFLSERAEFAQRCLDAGLVFIGPSPEAMRLMGSKIESKRVAREAGVPVLDGFATAGLNARGLAENARAIGFPLLVKASAGGGGRGMRVVRREADLDEALEAAAREAEAAFGDGTLFVERYLEAPRHVEVQVFGDHQGTVAHLFERECSIQRRHQKIVEEAPSPALNANLRARMGEAAVALARRIGYVGAGTVEFLLDATGAFHFLEMNTRLQVEHPVTEAITGLDLVRLQLDVAQGRPLPATRAASIGGHAIEVRLCAEDPARDFLPAAGRVGLWRVPVAQGVRVDAGVDEGSEVPVHYDSLLAKVIAHGATREEARRRLVRGLRDLAVGGIPTNREFLLRVLDHPAFIAGDLATDFIAKHMPAESRVPHADAIGDLAVAATLYLHEQRRAAGGPLPSGIPSGWRNNRSQSQEQAFDADGGRLVVRYDAVGDGAFEVEVSGAQAGGGAPLPSTSAPASSPLPSWEGAGGGGPQSPRMFARVIVAAPDGITLELDGVRRRYAVARDGERLIVHGGGACAELTRVPRFPARAGAERAGGCVAPMTGVIRKVCVVAGDRVEAGALLLVLEAMKMEHRLVADAGGVVKEVRVREGQMVDPDDVLVILDAEGPPRQP
jgi:acetyl/propionyl-CoA carboxylase alpha subunit